MLTHDYTIALSFECQFSELMCTAAEAAPPTTVTFFGLNVQVAVWCTSIADRVSAEIRSYLYIFWSSTVLGSFCILPYYAHCAH
jgi:hypothetical protein